MPYIIGTRINAYCATCRGDRFHIIMEMSGNRITAVKCEKCQLEGDFRAPRDKTKAAIMEFAGKRKRSTAPPKPHGRPRKSSSPKATFDRLVEGMNLSAAISYDSKARLKEGEIIEHSVFGIGIVTALIDPHKVKVVFENGERVMVCNRQ